MRSILGLSSTAALAALLGYGCTPFLGPADAGREAGAAVPGVSSESPRDAGLETASGESPVDAAPPDPADGHVIVDALNDFGELADASSLDADARPGERDANEAPTGPDLPRPGLLVQLEADYGLSATDSTPVSRWRDKSGNGFDATEPDPDFQPSFYAGLNAGLGAVGFGLGSGEDLNLPEGFTELQGGESLFFVVNLQKLLGVAVLLQTSPDGPTLTLSSDGITDLVKVGYHVGTGTTTAGDAYNFDNRLFHVVELVQQAGVVGGSAAFTAYLDGAALVTATQPVPTSALKTAQIGPTVGDAIVFMQAVLVYARPVSNDERAMVEKYLMTKYQIAQ